MKIENQAGLLTVAGTNQCLGFLLNFEGKGVFDASYGQVEVKAEEVDPHNKILSSMMIKGLDENCQIGQGNYFYYDKKKNEVHTFTGELVSADVHVKGQVITFFRNQKAYRGRLQKNGDSFNFRRIS